MPVKLIWSTLRRVKISKLLHRHLESFHSCTHVHRAKKHHEARLKVEIPGGIEKIYIDVAVIIASIQK